MKTISLSLSILMALTINSNVLAQGPNHDCDDFDLNTVTYIEEENEFDLGFNSEDYLPLDFDPHKIYVDLETINYMEEEELNYDFSANLPADFNAYAYPSYFRTIDYIDPTDEISLDFDSATYLPEGFDPYTRVSEMEILSL